MKVKWMKFAACFFILAGLVLIRNARADEMDMLLDKLVEKGILTTAEAQQVKVETQEEMKKTVVQGINETMPVLSQTKFTGDLRLRYQTSETTTTSETKTGIYRLRLRYGFETPINDWFKIGFRMASGSSADPSSTNQTEQDAFSKRALWIDRAYVQYTPLPWLGITGGKMPNPFYTTDLVWDSDIVPEGLLATFTPSIPGGAIKPFACLGYFPVQEDKAGVYDASLYAAQVGLTAMPFGKPLKVAVGTYNFTKLKGQKRDVISPNYKKEGNTLDGTGAFVYDYTPIQYGAEYTPWTFDLAGHAMPVKVYVDFVDNTASGVRDTAGRLYGIKIGDVQKLWDFQVDYNYRKLEADAIPVFISDSDFHGGGTNSEGSKVNIKMGLGRNAALGVTYFDTRAVSGAKNDFNLSQIDFEAKF